MPNNKPKEIRITKFYLLAWIFGLAALFCFWKDWLLPSGILLMFFIGYSRADYMHPPVERAKDSNDDGSGDGGGLAI